MKYAAAVLALLLLCSPAHAQEITVLLRSNVQQCAASAGSIAVSDGSGASVQTAGNSVSLFWRAGAAADASGAQYQLPLQISASDGIGYDGRRYNGIITVEAGSSGFNIVNRIDMEEYLKGVLKVEMSPKWPAEALKAQAVLARTYAAASRKHGKYNVCASSHCQNYVGIDDSPAISDAITATASEILTYSGAPAQVCYFGDSGGATASAKSVWGKDVPYLISRPEPMSYVSPVSTWQASVPVSQAESRLNAAGVSVGTLRSARISARDESGRAVQIELTGSLGQKLITASKFRAALGVTLIKSTLFDFSAMPASAAQQTPAPAGVPYASSARQPVQTQPAAAYKTYPKPDTSSMPAKAEDKLFWMAKNKIFTTAELMSMLGREKEYPKFIAEGMARINGKKVPVTQQKKTAAPAAAVPQAAASRTAPVSIPSDSGYADGSVITIYGRGSGHGVGMPQWGAKALAESGWDYRQILAYYFPGTTLERGIQ